MVDSANRRQRRTECAAQVVMDIMDAWASRRLAEDWDNPGLLVGSGQTRVTKILACLDVTAAIVDYAVAAGYQMIISHHPLIFKPQKNLRTDRPLGRILAKLLAHDIAVFAAHTNLDIAYGGVNDILAEKLGLINIAPFAVTGHDVFTKIVVFVPETLWETVRAAMWRAGAGHIGCYDECSYSMSGEGTFRPLPGAAPFCGTVGERAATVERRLEMVLPAERERAVIRALRAAHPYEEPAYDVIALKNDALVHSLGRVGELPEPMELTAFARHAAKSLDAAYVRLTTPPAPKIVRKIALCSGAGAEFIERAAFLGADVYLTGDVKYHDAQKAIELGLPVIDAGHFPTEYPVVAVIAEKLRTELARRGIDVIVTADADSRDIFQVVSAE